MHHGRGFTLVEMMVTMALIGIVATIAVPQFNQWQENQRLSGGSMSIRSALMLARSTAIEKNSPVVVAFDTIGGGGFSIFVDDGDLEREEGEEVIEERSMPSGVMLYKTGFSGGKACYNSMGFPVEAGTVFLKNSGATREHRVVLAAAGSVRIETGGSL